MMYPNTYRKKDKKEYEEDYDYVLARKTMRNLLTSSVDEPFKDYNRIFVDMDSLFSILIKVDLPKKKSERLKLCAFVLDLMRDFFYTYDDKAHIYLVYRFQPGDYYEKIYPDWNKERNERYQNKEVVYFLNSVLYPRLEKFSEVIKNVRLIKADEDIVPEIFKEITVLTEEDRRQAIILSRDPHMNCILAYYRTTIYNGKEYIQRGHLKNVDEIGDIHHSYLPWFYLLCGIKRDGYKGLHRWGPKKTVKYIQENKMKLINWEIDDEIKEVIPFKDIFFLNSIKI